MSDTIEIETSLAETAAAELEVLLSDPDYRTAYGERYLKMFVDEVAGRSEE